MATGDADICAVIYNVSYRYDSLFYDWKTTMDYQKIIDTQDYD